MFSIGIEARRALGAAAVGLIAIAACSAARVPARTSGPPGFDPASFCRDYFAPEIGSRGAADQVCSPEDRKTLDAMTSLGSHLIEACTLTLTRAQQSSRADIDSAAAARCLLARRRDDEHNLARLAPACSGTIRGRQGPGAPCALRLECGSGLVCRGGRCGPPAATGASCELDAAPEGMIDLDWGGHPACGSGLHCGVLPVVCVADTPDGGACTFNECSETSTCLRGRCVPDRPMQVGEPCLFDLQCAHGLYCRGASLADGVNGLAACAKRQSSGAPCDRGTACLGTCRDHRCVSSCISP
jgi:hypothetical protein